MGNFYSSSSEEMVHERNFNCNVTESARDTEDDLSATWEVSGQSETTIGVRSLVTPQDHSAREGGKKKKTLLTLKS